ncbi:MAG: chemotaxis-specific protein-glutamate methyltransferase CheB, partial [Gemmatimonadota bacterium]
MLNASSSRRRVLVVDDSAFIRRVVCDVIGGSPDFEVAGEAGDGYTALRLVQSLAPDLVTLDVQMPGLDGLATLGYIMREAPRPVVMLSAQADGGDTTIRALELGAVDFVRKPALGDAIDLATLQGRLLGALRTAAGSQCTSVPVLARTPVRARAPLVSADIAPTHVVVVAASTGGPRALAEIVPMLEPSTAAVIVVQHMPPGFTLSLARRLDALSALPVEEAVDGDRLRAGHAYVAPGGLHTTIVTRDGQLHLAVSSGAAVHGVAPAADPTLESAAAAFGARCVAVVLTGMGHDGARGARAVREAGGYVVVQDESTSIVYGMPQAALAAAGADAIASLDRVAEAVARGLRARGLDARGLDARGLDARG